MGKDRRRRGGSQHLGVVDAVRSRHHGMDQRGDSLSSEGLQVDEIVGEADQPEGLREHADEGEAGSGDGVIVIEGHGHTRRTVRRWHRKGASWPRESFGLSTLILPGHGTFFADGQSLNNLSGRWIQA